MQSASRYGEAPQEMQMSNEQAATAQHTPEEIQELRDWVAEAREQLNHCAAVMKATPGSGPGHHQMSGAEVDWADADREYREAKRELATALGGAL